MRTEQPKTIYLKDYKAPDYWIDETQLTFELFEDHALVHSRLALRLNSDLHGEGALPALTLHGQELALLKVVLDERELGEGDYQVDDDSLSLQPAAATFALALTTRIEPQNNTALEGLYKSGSMFCTQCEAEGFRKITYYLDRPDVMSRFTTTVIAERERYPVLLSNGNPIASGEHEGGRHWVSWEDPFPKPAYLFALVAGDLCLLQDSFTTMSGREIDLRIYVEPENRTQCDHAMDSLKRSMRWDEEVYGREYDLDIFMIVAVNDFNMGAMENKGLNVFNTKYVLADPETATDGDYDGIEGVIGHEYFHNWSGNRITCRDWFQLSLKEGFTVLRDQLFSQDMGSAPVKRIEDVRVLRGAQFPEDSGPLAHPIRPDSYREISNFYTATVYNKGAEVIRMMKTMAGDEAFRRGTDTYFDRHDGEAATCEDFVKSIEDGTGLDLSQFRLWYAQAGTPQVSVQLTHDGNEAVLELSQTIPDTPGQSDKKPMPIPLKIALFDRDSGAHAGEELIILDKASDTFRFPGFASKPVLSINRGFSAPISVQRDIAGDELVFLAASDDDPFARYEAMQDLMVGHLVAASKGALDDATRTANQKDIVRAVRSVIEDEEIDDLMRGELMSMPSQTYIMERLENADPGRIFEQREGLKAVIAKELEESLQRLYDRAAKVPYSQDPQAKGARKLKTLILSYLVAGDPQKATELASQQYEEADNMTDRQGALMVLTGVDSAERTNALLDFYNRYQGNSLVIDKWFSLQAMSLHPHVIEHVKALADHEDFTLKNPNRVRSLYMAFAANPHGFHASSGEGYRMIADLILELDPINSQTAARFVPSLGRWRKMEPGRSALMREQLERIAAAPKLSRDTFEQVTRSLG